MQLQVSFTTLLAGIFVALSSSSVDALPLAKRETPGVITLPLKRVELSRSVHPQILLQQHINRSSRRLARMTGRDEPTSEELTRHLEKRVIAVEGPEGLEKRYNRQGVPKSRPTSDTTLKTVSTKAKTNSQTGSGNNQKNGQANNGKGTANTNSGKGSKGATKGTSVTAGAANATSTSGAVTGGTNSTSTTAGAQEVAVDNVTNANTPATANSLGLDIEANDVGYLATVQMGTPPQDFLLLMDSGSADLWVGAENCQSQGGGDCGNHRFLGTTASSTFVDTNAPFSVTYGTGSVSGDIITDNLAIAGLQLTGHTFGVATTESVDFSSNTTPFDGLMGLAQSTLSEQKTATPIEALASQKLVNAAVIGYKISRLADNKNDGEITFGGTDPTKFDPASVVTLPNVNTQGFWESAMDAVSVNGQSLNLQGRTAILDTGTTLIVAPDADAQAVHAAIPGAQPDGQGGFTVPCTTTAQVALTFGGKAFAIEPKDIAFQPVDPNNPTGDCTSGIASGNIGGANEWLVGDVFLKNAYFSTDVGNNQMSLATLV
ncbi:acid protease [Macrolepiota fuliginosa MF-IS2]|uniref:Acid protease n=1 Tax=Macrolepiota fuliginosa MF-IS2 TaxID=1400762 RepID=A0A9P5XL24_9AGAR|nr:acid protease [Macrolepiota fuliginosa MF-IS2]